MISILPSSVQNVSRETFLLLEKYVALLQKWNKAINLVGKSTEAEIWKRHIDDSLQLLPEIPSRIKTIADLGSGAGLPGIVIAIARPDIQVTLVEIDQRKSAFHQEVAAQLALKNITVSNADLHKVDQQFDMVTARALAPLSQLCAMAFPLFSSPDTLCLFPKGKNFANELVESQQDWDYQYHVMPSRTQEDSSIVSISKLSKKQSG